MDVDAAVPSSRHVPLSMNRGRPLAIDDPSSPAVRELVRLARRLVSDDVTPDEIESNGSQARHTRTESSGWFRKKNK
jgi:hypothetical protein